jgi:hypothetical protein
MRAKTVNEAQNFQRDQDPKASMGIGKAEEAKRMLESVYKKGEHSRFTTYEYSIKSLDHIEISYSDIIKQDIRDSAKLRGQKDRSNVIWILKFVEKDRYLVEANSYEMSSFTHSFGTQHDWKIYELKFRMDDDPKRIKFDKEYVLDLTQKNEINKERAKIIVDSLNNHYGKVSGFELIETLNNES